jgi:hypothetical protein
MVLRPKNIEPEQEAPDVEFVEQLVRASLAVNKDLRNGESTTRYLKRLREQAKAQSEGGGAAAPAAPKAPAAPPTPARSQLDRKAGTLNTFLESKAVDFDGQHEELRDRRRQLDEEESALRQRFVDDLVDMLTLVTDGEDLNGFRTVLTKHKAFLSLLGTRDVDLLKSIKRR